MERRLVVPALIGLVAGLLVLLVIGLLLWSPRRPAPPTPPPPPPTTTLATPATVVGTPEPTVPPSEPPTSATRPQPTPRAPRAATSRSSPTPGPATTAPALAEAHAAAAAGRYQEAVTLFDRILAHEPRNSAALEGRAGALATAAALRRSFVPGLASAERSAAATERLSGFEDGGVQVKGAAQVNARIEFAVTPERVKPGDPYAIQVFLRNLGRKEIKIKAIHIVQDRDGQRQAVGATPRTNSVDERKRGLVEELRGVWPGDARSWRLEVLVASKRGDLYRGHLDWKEAPSR